MTKKLITNAGSRFSFQFYTKYNKKHNKIILGQQQILPECKAKGS